MPENRDAGVDPRFDPVFQRGYDPAVHGGRRARTTARHATGPIPIASPRQPLAPVVEEPVEAAPAAHVDAKASAEPATERRPDPAAEADVALSTRNPFRLSLLIVSMVAVAAAVWMIWNRVGEDVYYGGFSGTNQGLLFRSQLFAALPVPLLTGGILGLILWLAIGAMAHRAPDDSGVDGREVDD